MKSVKFLFLVAFACVSGALSAQKITQGDLKFLKNESKLHCKFDFSETTIVGFGKEEFDEWFATLGKDSTFYAKRFYSGVADELGNRFLLIGEQPSANFQAVIQIMQISPNGDIKAFCKFSHMNSDDELCVAQLNGSGGRFGSFMGLVGDGMRELGENFGKLLRKKSK